MKVLSLHAIPNLYSSRAEMPSMDSGSGSWEYQINHTNGDKIRRLFSHKSSLHKRAGFKSRLHVADRTKGPRHYGTMTQVYSCCHLSETSFYDVNKNIHSRRTIVIKEGILIIQWKVQLLSEACGDLSTRAQRILNTSSHEYKKWQTRAYRLVEVGTLLLRLILSDKV